MRTPEEMASEMRGMADQILSQRPAGRELFEEVADSLDAMRLMKEQVRISDEGFDFHLKRANELMNKFNGLEAELADCQKRLEEARWLLLSGRADMPIFNRPPWNSRRNAFLATFKDKP